MRRFGCRALGVPHVGSMDLEVKQFLDCGVEDYGMADVKMVFNSKASTAERCLARGGALKAEREPASKRDRK